MRIGILDLLASTMPGRWSQETVGNYFLIKQYASIMPQAIAVWCRQSAHQVYYATYFGQGDPQRLLPNDLDLVFIAAYTHSSALAYALAKLYHREGTVTVLGGPHAKSFPQDSLRFFDLVVQQCDQALIADILSGQFAPGTVVSSRRPLADIPSVEERMPEIRASVFTRGRPYLSTTVPMLSSVGCPYDCNFCTDWNNPHALLPLDRLEADLRYLSSSLPGVRLSFHDPNFGVKFDQVLGVMEGISPEVASPYVMESSLSILRGSRLQRLQATRCLFVAPGVESWDDYSNKANVGRTRGAQKLGHVIEQFKMLHSFVPGLQANFVFGLDVDEGEGPVELTKEFMTRAPFVWPVVNVPTPFGGTPLYDQYLEEGRILTAMPLAFYYPPLYAVATLKHYDPVTYYEKLIELSAHSASRAMLWQRLRSTSSWPIRGMMIVRRLALLRRIRDFQRILEMLTTDRQFRAFHEGKSQVLPEFYHQEYERRLGPYAGLLSREDRVPVLGHTVATHSTSQG